MKVLVGLSGGVDSAVAAYLLKEQGYEVVGGFMKNYSEDSGTCTTREDAESAIEVAKFLGIELQVFDFEKEYEKRILNYIFDGYKNGITPNPDILCNNLVKFDLFLDEALNLGFDKIAMGHYARTSLYFSPIMGEGSCTISSNESEADDFGLNLTEDNIKKRGLVRDGKGIPYNKKSVEKAKLLRKNITRAEKMLWENFLRGHQSKFYKQIPLDHFIADFYCAKKRLVIEIDGGIHETEDNEAYDKMRTELLNLYNLRVIRFSNDDVINNFDYVCNKIDKEFKFSSPCRRGLGRGPTQRWVKLLRGKDHNKDQSYFLSGLNQVQLSKALFPLGALEKPEVRAIAKKIGLPNAERKDSQGLCFVGNVPIKDFLMKKLPITSGNILDDEGNILGQHDGAWFFTIGQNRGLKLNHKAYVYKIDVKNNIVYVNKDKEDIKLKSKKVKLYNRNWIGEKYNLPLSCEAKIRYRQELQKCEVKNEYGEFFIEFEKKQWAVAPGQTIVAYLCEECIGSGIIV